MTATVDGRRRSRSPDFPHDMAEEAPLVRAIPPDIPSGMLVPWIKAHRVQFGSDLKTARDAVYDGWRPDRPVEPLIDWRVRAEAAERARDEALAERDRLRTENATMAPTTARHPKPPEPKTMSGDLADRLEKLADERAAFVEEGRSVAGTWFEWPEHEIAEAEAESELLRSAAAALRREWRPIETAPKDGTPILVHALELEDPCLIVAEWAEFDGDPEGGSWVERWGCGESCNPTHWMPLPPPPTPPQGGE